MSELAYLTVAAAGGLLREKKISPVEYARALIDRIQRQGALVLHGFTGSPQSMLRCPSWPVRVRR